MWPVSIFPLFYSFLEMNCIDEHLNEHLNIKAAVTMEQVIRIQKAGNGEMEEKCRASAPIVKGACHKHPHPHTYAESHTESDTVRTWGSLKGVNRLQYSEDLKTKWK